MPITFKVSNVLAMSATDTVVILSASTNFTVSSLTTSDLLLVRTEFLRLTGPCTLAGECPVTRSTTLLGMATTAATAAQNAVVTLVRRPTNKPPTSSEVTFSISAAFG